MEVLQQEKVEAGGSLKCREWSSLLLKLYSIFWKSPCCARLFRDLEERRVWRGGAVTRVCEPVHSSAVVKVGQPVEEPDARRCPRLRNKLPVVAGNGAMEDGQVG